MSALVELDITTVAHGGVMVARHEGRVVFVTDAIPGERVVARISDDSKERFWRAEAIEVLEASPHRREHVWPEAGIDRDPALRPGGADFGHIAPDHQRALKAQVLREAMARMAGLELETVVEKIPGEADGTGWRTRERLHVDADGRVGPFAARSHRVVPVSSLPLAVPELRPLAPLDERMSGTANVDLVAPSTGSPWVLAEGSRGGVITERVGDRDFRLDARGFWQVHRQAAETLSAAVRTALEEASLEPKAANLDLYGGVGLLAAALGDAGGPATHMTSVESQLRATRHAAANLAEWVGARAVTARVEQYLRELTKAPAGERARQAAATVILDPPRSGAGKETVRLLAGLAPAQLVYACDPVALARDTGLLAGHGYRLASLRAFDLFPNTHHLEAVARFVPDRG